MLKIVNLLYFVVSNRALKWHIYCHASKYGILIFFLQRYHVFASALVYLIDVQRLNEQR